MKRNFKKKLDFFVKISTENKVFGDCLNSISYEDGKISPKCEISLCMEQHKIENSMDAASVIWESMKNTPEVTMGGIAKNLSTPLGLWSTEAVDNMTSFDEMDFDNIGVEKTAIFLIIKPARNPYKSIVNIFYSQLFERLMYIAKEKYSGKLPQLVSCELDEFANIGVIPSFCETLSVVRSFNIRICIVLQGLSQLKALYKDTWEGILSNCSLFTYLGTNDLESKKYIVEKLGKTTVRSESKSWNQSNTGGGSSTSEHYDSRDLVTLEELPQIIKKNKAYGGSCILFIDEFKPFYRPKFNTKKHIFFSKTGSSFPDGIPNNTDINMVYSKKPKRQMIQKTPDVRKLLELQEETEQKVLQSEFLEANDLL